MKTSRFPGLIALILTLSSLVLITPSAEAQRRRAVSRHSGDHSLTGVVTDVTSGAPIEGVEVAIQGIVRTTDDQGVYLFDELHEGTWQISVGRWGYETKSMPIQIAAGSNHQDFQLQLLPFVTITKTDGSVHHLTVESIRFGYIIPFAGTFSSEVLKVCTTDPSTPIELSPAEIASIEGPSERVQTQCCPGSAGERLSFRRKNGETFDAIVLDSCPPYETFILGRSLDSGAGLYSRFSQTARVEFP